MRGIWDLKRSGVSLRPALYSGSRSYRKVRTGASKATARYSGFSSASSFTSIDVNPKTAFVTVPALVARSVGRA